MCCRSRSAQYSVSVSQFTVMPAIRNKKTRRQYRWVPLCPNMDNPNSRQIRIPPKKLICNLFNANLPAKSKIWFIPKISHEGQLYLLLISFLSLSLSLCLSLLTFYHQFSSSFFLSFHSHSHSLNFRKPNQLFLSVLDTQK